MTDKVIPPAGKLDVTSPFDGRLLATVDTDSTDTVDAALSAAYDLFRDRSSWLSVPERVAILERTAALMEAQKDELAKLAASEGGKPLQDSLVEVTRAVDGVRLCVETLRGNPGEVIPVATTPATMGRIANLIVHQVAPAIATGCPVVVKPAGDTPLSCLRFVELLRETGLPAAWCQAIIADTNETAEKLVTDSRVGFFSFIGSAKIGWMLRSKLAPGTRCALEHGGAAPVFLLDDFEFDATVASVLKGGFYHAGQVCVSVQRLFAPRQQSRSFAIALAKQANDLVVGDPGDQTTEVGPLIRAAEVGRVAEWVDEAVAAGAELLCGGKRLQSNCYAPTVLLDPPRDARVSTQEIFGPVICVYSYDDLTNAVAQANSLPTAFQAAIFGKDISHVMQLVQLIDASAIMINDHSAFRDDVMPFAGLRESGLGVGGIPYTMHDMQIDKMIVIKTAGVKK